MRVLLDTNIVIHRETSRVINDDIGKLFRWLDQLKYDKCIHPLSVEEIDGYSDKEVVKSFKIKIDNYHILKTIAPLDESFKNLVGKDDQTPNSRNDTKLLNELHKDRIDIIITEDRGIHKKAQLINSSDKVFTIESFLEKVNAENPSFVNYDTLAVKKVFFGNVNLQDNFFDSFREDYINFDRWFNRKSDDLAYVCEENGLILAFLYLKIENVTENYSDITPSFAPKKRLKIGTFKVSLNGFKLGERFLKILFDNAINYKVDELYVTIFRKRFDQERLIKLLEDWGFFKYGEKDTSSGIEEVYVRNFEPQFNVSDPQKTYPFVSTQNNVYIVPIYPQYHTELFPDSILRTESPSDFVENQPHRNAISKVYISRSFERGLKRGDIIVFYRTGGYYKGVVTTIGIVEDVYTNIPNLNNFLSLCRKRSVFSDKELNEHWDYNKNSRPFIVNFLYTISFPKRLNLARLIELNIISSIDDVPRGFSRISLNNLNTILKEAQVNESYIVD